MENDKIVIPLWKSPAQFAVVGFDLVGWMFPDRSTLDRLALVITDTLSYYFDEEWW